MSRSQIALAVMLTITVVCGSILIWDAIHNGTSW